MEGYLHRPACPITPPDIKHYPAAQSGKLQQ